MYDIKPSLADSTTSAPKNSGPMKAAAISGTSIYDSVAAAVPGKSSLPACSKALNQLRHPNIARLLSCELVSRRSISPTPAAAAAASASGKPAPGAGLQHRLLVAPSGYSLVAYQRTSVMTPLDCAEVTYGLIEIARAMDFCATKALTPIYRLTLEDVIVCGVHRPPPPPPSVGSPSQHHRTSSLKGLVSTAAKAITHSTPAPTPLMTTSTMSHTTSDQDISPFAERWVLWNTVRPRDGSLPAADKDVAAITSVTTLAFAEFVSDVLHAHLLLTRPGDGAPAELVTSLGPNLPVPAAVKLIWSWASDVMAASVASSTKKLRCPPPALSCLLWYFTPRSMIDTKAAPPVPAWEPSAWSLSWLDRTMLTLLHQSIGTAAHADTEEDPALDPTDRGAATGSEEKVKREFVNPMGDAAMAKPSRFDFDVGQSMRDADNSSVAVLNLDNSQPGAAEDGEAAEDDNNPTTTDPPEVSTGHANAEDEHHEGETENNEEEEREEGDQQSGEEENKSPSAEGLTSSSRPPTEIAEPVESTREASDIIERPETSTVVREEGEEEHLQDTEAPRSPPRRPDEVEPTREDASTSSGADAAGTEPTVDNTPAVVPLLNQAPEPKQETTIEETPERRPSISVISQDALQALVSSGLPSLIDLSRQLHMFDDADLNDTLPYDALADHIQIVFWSACASTAVAKCGSPSFSPTDDAAAEVTAALGAFAQLLERRILPWLLLPANVARATSVGLTATLLNFNNIVFRKSDAWSTMLSFALQGTETSWTTSGTEESENTEARRVWFMDVATPVLKQHVSGFALDQILKILQCNELGARDIAVRCGVLRSLLTLPGLTAGTQSSTVCKEMSVVPSGDTEAGDTVASQQQGDQQLAASLSVAVLVHFLSMDTLYALCLLLGCPYLAPVKNRQAQIAMDVGPNGTLQHPILCAVPCQPAVGSSSAQSNGVIKAALKLRWKAILLHFRCLRWVIVENLCLKLESMQHAEFLAFVEESSNKPDAEGPSGGKKQMPSSLGVRTIKRTLRAIAVTVSLCLRHWLLPIAGGRDVRSPPQLLNTIGGSVMAAVSMAVDILLRLLLIERHSTGDESSEKETTEDDQRFTATFACLPLGVVPMGKVASLLESSLVAPSDDGLGYRELCWTAVVAAIRGGCGIKGMSMTCLGDASLRGKPVDGSWIGAESIDWSLLVRERVVRTVTQWLTAHPGRHRSGGPPTTEAADASWVELPRLEITALLLPDLGVLSGVKPASLRAAASDALSVLLLQSVTHGAHPSTWDVSEGVMKGSITAVPTVCVPALTLTASDCLQLLEHRLYLPGLTPSPVDPTKSTTPAEPPKGMSTCVTSQDGCARLLHALSTRDLVEGSRFSVLFPPSV